MMKTAIIANTYQQYVQWCRDHDIGQHDPRVFYCDSAYRLRGYRDLNVIHAGRLHHKESSEQALRVRLSIHQELTLIEKTGGTVVYDQEPWKEADAAH